MPVQSMVADAVLHCGKLGESYNIKSTRCLITQRVEADRPSLYLRLAFGIHRSGQRGRHSIQEGYGTTFAVSLKLKFWGTLLQPHVTKNMWAAIEEDNFAEAQVSAISDRPKYPQDTEPTAVQGERKAGIEITEEESKGPGIGINLALEELPLFVRPVGFEEISRSSMVARLGRST